MPMKARAASSSVLAGTRVWVASMKKRMICGLTSCMPMLPSSSTLRNTKRRICGRMYFANRSQYCWKGIFKRFS